MQGRVLCTTCWILGMHFQQKRLDIKVFITTMTEDILSEFQFKNVLRKLWSRPCHSTTEVRTACALVSSAIHILNYAGK